MNRRMNPRSFCVLAVMVFVASGVFAACAPGVHAAEGDDAQADATIDRLMLGYAFVWLLTAGYLVVSYRRNARLKEDIEFLKRRVDEL